MFNIPRTLSGRTDGRPGARRLLRAAATWLLAAAVVPASAAPVDDTVVTVNEKGGVYSVSATFTVPQSPDAVRATLTDYARIPRFMPEVRTSQVLERTDEGAVVEQEAVARFLMFSQQVHLVLDVQQERDRIQFKDRCGRSFARYEGLWMMTPHAGGTSVTYDLSAQPSFNVPEFLLKRLLKRDASQMIDRLRAEIAERAAESAR